MTTLFLITDFGLGDHYVGVMKAVIAGISPETTVIDLTHAVPPQNVQAAAMTLLTTNRYLPDGSVVCAVVDPGVGSERRALAAQLELGDRRLSLVCPDNGILTPLLERAHQVTAVALDNPEFRLPRVSATFHGRDIFAPAAAYLAAGTPIGRLGSALARDRLKRLDWPAPRPERSGWRGSVLHIDHFGNLITNLTASELGDRRSWTIRVGNQIITGINRTFADAAIGKGVAYLGSGGYLELAVRNGDAAGVWGATVGADVVLEDG